MSLQLKYYGAFALLRNGISDGLWLPICPSSISSIHRNRNSE